jgi:SAM-dependent methyltransferase
MRKPRKTDVMRAARVLVRRRYVDDPIDWLRFRIDTLPRGGPLRRLAYVDYQPLPWVGLHEAERDGGTLSRWEAIWPLVERTNCRTALDLGCNRGFFSIELARRDLAVIGVEPDPPVRRTALYAIRKMGLDNAGVLAMAVSPATVQLLPPADAVLFLSLWHHLVRAHGPDCAIEMLSAIWERARKVLFFDTGESEMPAEYKLPPMTPTPRDWLDELLARACPGGEVIHCGTHDAFAPDGSFCRRNLFAVVRASAVHFDSAARSDI